MVDGSAIRRVPAVVRHLRARLRDRWTPRSSVFEGIATGSGDAESESENGVTVNAGYFCRTCGAGFEGRHGTCPRCGGGMIERSV